MRKAIKLLIFSLFIVIISGRNEQKANETAKAFENSNQQIETSKIIRKEISIEVFKPVNQNENRFEFIEIKSGLSYRSNNILTTINVLSDLRVLKMENDKINSEKSEVTNNNVPMDA